MTKDQTDEMQHQQEGDQKQQQNSSNNTNKNGCHLLGEMR